MMRQKSPMLALGLAGLFLSAGLPPASSSAPRAMYRSPGKPQAPVRITLSTAVSQPRAGEVIPIVVEVTPTVEAEALQIRVRLPPGLGLLAGDSDRGPEYVPGGETRRIELEAVALAPGQFDVAAVATLHVGNVEQTGTAIMRIRSPDVTARPSAKMTMQKTAGQPGHDDRYVTVVGTVIE